MSSNGVSDIHKLRQLRLFSFYRVDAAVRAQWTRSLEDEFRTRAGEAMAAGQYEVALRSALAAFAAFESSPRRDSTIEIALAALRALGDNLDQVSCLAEPELESAKEELRRRQAARDDREAWQEFERLDGEPILLKKDFARLRELLEVIHRDDDPVARLRLTLEERAQAAFRVLIDEVRGRVETGMPQPSPASSAAEATADATGNDDGHRPPADPTFDDLDGQILDAMTLCSGLKTEYAAQIEVYVVAVRQLIAGKSLSRLEFALRFEAHEGQRRRLRELAHALSGADPTEAWKAICDVAASGLAQPLTEQLGALVHQWIDRRLKPALASPPSSSAANTPMVLDSIQETLDRHREVLPAWAVDKVEALVKRARAAHAPPPAAPETRRAHRWSLPGWILRQRRGGKVA